MSAICSFIQIDFSKLKLKDFSSGSTYISSRIWFKVSEKTACLSKWGNS